MIVQIEMVTDFFSSFGCVCVCICTCVCACDKNLAACPDKTYKIKGKNCLPPQENNHKQRTTKATLVADQRSFSFVKIDSVDLEI